jgi:hypothetical protein
VHVPDGLAAFPPGVEDDTVTAAVDALRDRHLVRVRDHLVEQAAGRGQSRDVRVVIPRDHKDVRGRLGTDVAKGERPVPLQHERGRYLSGRDPAEQALWHSTIIVAGASSCLSRAARVAAVPIPHIKIDIFNVEGYAPC